MFVSRCGMIYRGRMQSVPFSSLGAVMAQRLSRFLCEPVKTE